MKVYVMITSKSLIEQTGISRATLNNYIGLGLVMKPVVKRIASTPGATLTTIGYFPDWTLDKIKQIQSLKLLSAHSCKSKVFHMKIFA